MMISWTSYTEVSEGVFCAKVVATGSDLIRRSLLFVHEAINTKIMNYLEAVNTF